MKMRYAVSASSIIFIIPVLLLNACVTDFRSYRQTMHPEPTSFGYLDFSKNILDSSEWIYRELPETCGNYQILNRHFYTPEGEKLYLLTSVIYAQRTVVILFPSVAHEIVSIGRLINEYGENSFLLFHEYGSSGGWPEPPCGILIQTENRTYSQLVEIDALTHVFLVQHFIPEDFMLSLLEAELIGINPQYPGRKGSRILLPPMKWLTEEQIAMVKDFIRYTAGTSYSSLFNYSKVKTSSSFSTMIWEAPRISAD